MKEGLRKGALDRSDTGLARCGISLYVCISRCIHIRVPHVFSVYSVVVSFYCPYLCPHHLTPLISVYAVVFWYPCVYKCICLCRTSAYPSVSSVLCVCRSGAYGVEVKMITGDHLLIAKETVRRFFFRIRGKKSKFEKRKHTQEWMKMGRNSRDD